MSGGKFRYFQKLSLDGNMQTMNADTLQFISLHSQLELYHFALFFMQIRHVSHHLGPQKDIQLLPVPLIYQLRHATPLGLEVAGL